MGWEPRKEKITGRNLVHCLRINEKREWEKMAKWVMANKRNKMETVSASVVTLPLNGLEFVKRKGSFRS